MYARRIAKFTLAAVTALFVIGLVQAQNELSKQHYRSADGVIEACDLQKGSKGTVQGKGKVPIGGGAIKSDSELVEIDFKIYNCGSESKDQREQPTINTCTFTKEDADPHTVTCDAAQVAVPKITFKGKKDAEPKPYWLCCWLYSGCYLKQGETKSVCKT